MGLCVAQTLNNQIVVVFVITNTSLNSYLLDSGVVLKTVRIFFVVYFQFFFKIIWRKWVMFSFKKQKFKGFLFSLKMPL